MLGGGEPSGLGERRVSTSDIYNGEYEVTEQNTHLARAACIGIDSGHPASPKPG